MVYQISSGQGPAECELGVAKLAEYIVRNCKDAKIIATSKGYHNGTYRSVQIETDENLSHFVGSILWICKSPYRPTHGRKNWFLDFSLCHQGELADFDEEQILFESIRSRGKGGQNVNKVETGIRAIYLPTGDTVVCMEERTQLLNKHRAMQMLQTKLEDANAESLANDKDSAWRRHTQLKRGNQVAIFEGMKFVLIK